MTIRKPVQIVEIDVDQCSLTYGTSPCAAVLGTTGAAKCFNTFPTCQDRANYTRSTLTLRFAQNQDGLPKTVLIFPALAGEVAGTSTRINLGGVDDRTGPLGRRETIKVSLMDFAYGDAKTDKYASERQSGAAQSSGIGYDPKSRGTFFTKLRARNPYYVGRAMRVLDGYAGDALGDMTARHYVITKWVGPSASGLVEIEAKDVLDLADNKKALCPKPSQGKLSTGFGADFLGEVLVNPPGVGSEYPNSGRICIGSEVMTFTRSGRVFTITGRGLDGTEAAEHNEDDTVQLCYHVRKQPIADVIYDLLRNYAGVPDAFLPLADWQDEGTRWLAAHRLTATITSPEGVTRLLGELTELGCYIWWDKEAQRVQFRANRPVDLGETFADITDAQDVIQGSLSVEAQDDKRLSQVVVAHGMIDPTGPVSDAGNYRRVQAYIDLAAQSVNEYGQERSHFVYSRWLGAGDDGIASTVANRMLVRFRDPPTEVSFKADIRSRDNYGVADLVTMQTRVLVDETGLSVATPMQIIASEIARSGADVRITAQTYEFDGRYGFIAEEGRPDYTSSTDAQKAKGTYISDAAGLMSNGDPGYQIF